MPARELVEWAAFYELEPFGEWRADLRMAVLASLIANANRDPEKRPEPFTVDDFMLRFGESATSDAEQERSPEEWEALLVMLNAAYGGRDLRTG